jgi:hypothetical protein
MLYCRNAGFFMNHFLCVPDYPISIILNFSENSHRSSHLKMQQHWLVNGSKQKICSHFLQTLLGSSLHLWQIIAGVVDTGGKLCRQCHRNLVNVNLEKDAIAGVSDTDGN